MCGQTRYGVIGFRHPFSGVKVINSYAVKLSEVCSVQIQSQILDVRHQVSMEDATANEYNTSDGVKITSLLLSFFMPQ